MDFTWLNTSWTAVLMVIISSIGIYAALIALTRISGLRSFSKMSSFDFAMTVAIGSLVASTIISNNPPTVPSHGGTGCALCLADYGGNPSG